MRSMSGKILDVLDQRALILDGAMGTNLQNQNLTVQDFGGKDGCNEYLILTKPGAVSRVHESFFAAGCDAVETNTFGANRIILAEYGLEGLTAELNEKAVLLARRAAEKFSSASHPRFVIASVGPGTKLPSLGHISFNELTSVYEEQIAGLIRGGPDALLIETCQDLLQAKIAVLAAESSLKKAGCSLPVMLQVTFEPSGTMLLGTEMNAVIAALEPLPVDVLGMNCATGPREMAEPLRYLCENSNKLVSALPNAGLPENIGGKAHYNLSPAEFAEAVERFVREFGVSIVGGCCGTTPDHLAAAVKKLGGIKPARRTAKFAASCSSLYFAVPYGQEPPPLLVGEQTNANGSRKFREALEKDDYDGLVHIAREAVKEGAHLVDVCLALVGRDEMKDMTETLRRFNQQVPLPVMIDSTDPRVMEAALKCVGGKPILNSVNLEDGEGRFETVCRLAKKFGAGLIALTIDEAGMAKTHPEKLRIAKRMHDLAVSRYGIRPEDLFFDALTFAISSGEDFRDSAVETLEAIRRIKKELPGVRTILGLSNVSFGLAPHARPILNSVFLSLAVEAGLDAAIVHARKIIPTHKIAPGEVELAKALLLNDRAGGNDPLQAFIDYFEKQKGRPTTREKKTAPGLNIEETLKQKIIDGEKEGLEDALELALKRYRPLEIVNDILLGAMKTVGDLFGAGKTQLPFVLQSAEVMKRAVSYLEPLMEKAAATGKGTMVLATVKGDVHDIGKNLVDIILTNNGYRVINLGIKQPIDSILKAANEHKADAVGLSGLLVKSTQIMKEDLEEMNLRAVSLPVILGGAALTRRFVEEDLRGLYQGDVYYGQDAFAGLKLMDHITGPDYVPGAEKKTKGRAAKTASVPVPPADPAPAILSQVARDQAVPHPPFWGFRIVEDIPAAEVLEWIDKVALLRARWQFRRGSLTLEDHEKLIREKAEPLLELWKERVLREKILEPKVIYGFYPCFSEANDLAVLDETGKKELIRFTFPRQRQAPHLCLSDYFRSRDAGTLDVLGLHLVTVGPRASEVTQELFQAGRYSDYLYLHGLSVEAAEGLAELFHARIRRELGIASKDGATIEEFQRHQRYQGCRYSFGYPACPSLEDQSKFFAVLPGEKIGVSLTESFHLVPEQSTTALIVHHPEARYFSV